MAVGLSIDWVACDGRGMCAELVPERIHLDRWGFPVVDGRALDRRDVAHARAAVGACPTLALRLREVAER